MSAEEGAPGERRRVVIVAARNEADLIGDTLTALEGAFAGARLIVADDASEDGTAHVALQRGIEVVRGGHSRGKGQNVTRAARRVLHLSYEPDPPTFLLCDADLGASAAALSALVDAVEAGQCDIAVAAFARRRGGGFGVAVGFARWAGERLFGQRLRAPLSGQRAVRAEAFQVLVPFAGGYGMELGIASDAVRAGYTIEEIELDLEHRHTGRTPAGFLHRARQLRDLVRAYVDRRYAIG
jgi:glycosyltransferase involved in cell wall biosynthesis